MAKTEAANKITAIGALIDRAEWDFSTCPEDRLYFCFTYEYAREIPEVIARFRQAKKNDPSQFDQHGQWHHVISSDHANPEGACIEAIDAPVGFPEKPYLSTTHHVTESSYIPFMVGYKPLLPVTVKPDGGYRADDRYHPNDLPPEEVDHFHVEWHFSNKPIIEAFADWLENARGDRKPQEKRGTGNVRRSRSELKALGAVRLMRHFAKHSGTIEDALEYTAGLGINDSRGIFVEETGWSAAQGDVQKIINDWLTE